MALIPENVRKLIADPAAVKVLVTSSAEGRPHAIVAGTILSPTPDTMAVGVVLMHRAAKNLAANPKAAFLITKGMESYEINVRFEGDLTSGPLYDGVKAECDKLKLPLSAVKTFKVCCVCNESAGPDAGKKIA